MGKLGIYYDPPANAGGTDLITDASHLVVSQLMITLNTRARRSR
jgi:hypothetical protein